MVDVKRRALIESLERKMNGVPCHGEKGCVVPWREEARVWGFERVATVGGKN